MEEQISQQVQQPLLIHGDRRLPALVQGDELPWRPSPLPGVERRMLERVGGEVALATSIVRYAPGSHFSAHTHALGEEFVVLEGVFSDEHGDYPAGSYVRNPPRSSHTPFSTDGCVIFVKLRQMRESDQQTVRVRPEARQWKTASSSSGGRALLHAGQGFSVELVRLPANALWQSDVASTSTGGEELLVLEGSLALTQPADAALRPWGWSRLPQGGHQGTAGAEGALLWIKRGHL